MKISRKSQITVLSLIISSVALPASALMVTDTIRFAATDFVIPLDPGSPPYVTSVSGSFSVTFDTEAIYLVMTSGVSVHNLNALVGGVQSTYIPPGPAQFVYVPNQVFYVNFSQPQGYLYSLSMDANWVTHTGSGTSAGNRQMVYETPFSFAHISTDFTYSVDTISGVPEASTYAMFSLGLGIVAFSIFRRTRQFSNSALAANIAA